MSSDLRVAFEYFLLHCSLESGLAYREALSKIAQWVVTAGSSSTIPISEGNIIKLRLDHLRLVHWLPTDPLLREWCEKLHQQFVTNPFTAMSTAEATCRDLVAVFIGDMSIGQGPLYSADLTGTTSDKIIEEHPELKKHVVENEVTVLIDPETMNEPLRFLRQLNADCMDRLIVTSGVVVNASRPFLKASRLVIRCKDCGRIKAIKMQPWKQGTTLPRTCDSGSDPVAGGTGGTDGSKKCSLDPYEILSERSEYRDMQTLKIQELPDQLQTGDIPKHIVVNVPSVLVGRAVPGFKAYISGIFSTTERSGPEKSVKSGYLHAVGISPIDTNTRLDKGHKFTQDEIERFHKLALCPDVIQKISDSIAPSICGVEDIKRSVACLLFGGSRKCLPDGSTLRGDIHLLLLGDPSTAKSQILKYVSKVAPVACYTSGKGSSAAGLTAALIRDSSGNFALEGGAMVLSDGGVVCIDEFDKMRDDDRVAIHEAMEQQTISIAKAGINAVLKTECAVLAAANPTYGSYDETKDSADQHNFEATILSRFDCIWLVRDQKEAERDRAIAQHVFSLFCHSASTNANTQAPIEAEELKRYIAYCRWKCRPRLSEAAAKKLENFYVEVRDTVRRSGRQKKEQIPIAVRQLESLVRLAESFAKMTLSAKAGINHVDEAIRLFKISTVATNQATVKSYAILPQEIQAIELVKETIMRVIPINGRTSRTALIRNLKSKDFEPLIVVKAISVLITRGVLQERSDGSLKRIGSD